MTTGKKFLAVMIVLCLILINGCNDEANDMSKGTLIISLTDAPFNYELLKEANVTINKIELREKGQEESSFIVLSEDEKNINLLDLQNGITEELVNLEVPAGDYDLLRLYITKSSVVLKEGTEFDLKVPSSMQSGLKVFVKPDLSVAGGLTTELLLDFNVGRSFVPKGNIELQSFNGFNFKPVIRAVNKSITGRIEGIVTDSNSVEIPETMVWVEKDTVVSSTLSDEDGFYALVGLPSGQYQLYGTKSGYDTLVVEEINVDVANKTTVDVEINEITQ